MWRAHGDTAKRFMCVHRGGPAKEGTSTLSSVAHTEQMPTHYHIPTRHCPRRFAQRQLATALACYMCRPVAPCLIQYEPTNRVLWDPILRLPHLLTREQLLRLPTGSGVVAQKVPTWSRPNVSKDGVGVEEVPCEWCAEDGV